MITKLRNRYFQKSRCFLYPALGLIRADDFTLPLQTYISWPEKGISDQDCTLICLYQKLDNSYYDDFEKTIMKSPLYLGRHEISEDRIAYTFDFSRYKTDWLCFIGGKYSRFSTRFKERIQEYYGTERDEEFGQVDSYLNPQRYFGLYARMLGMASKELQQVGELCSPPDLDKEKLNAVKEESLESLKKTV